MTELPKSWATARLVDICHINPRVDKSQFDADQIVAFVPMPAVEAETGKVDVSESRKFSQVKQGYTPFKTGDVLFAKITPCMENGKMAIVPRMISEYGFGSTEFHVLRPADGVAPEYVYYAVSNLAFRYYAEHNMTGAVGQKRVPAAVLEEHEIGVPPVAEQRRIVARIEAMFDEIDHGVENLKKAKATLGLFRQSLLKAAFEGRLTADWRAQNPDKLEDAETLLARIQKEREARYQTALDEWQKALADWRAGGEIGKKPAKPKRPREFKPLPHERLLVPSAWATVPLGGVAAEAVLGKMLDRQKNRGTPRSYLGNINLRWGSFDIDSEKTMLIEDHEVPRYGIRAGDLIVCEGGEPGRSAVWQGQDDVVFIQKALHRVRFTQSYEAKFAFYFLKFAASAGLLARHFTGSTIKHLTGAALNEVLFPVCPPSEQAEITRILDERLSAADAMEAEIDAGLTRAEALRQSILKQAFSGKLVPQDPHDEPASVLLERIKAEKAKAPKSKRRRKATA